MKKCCFIIPYFGKLPNYFQLFLKTCRLNPTFNWLIFTDDHTKYEYPDNFHVVYMEFAEIQKKIQDKFDFPICINRPYKLCDFKPAYGYIFEDYLRDYAYWGFCDVDTLMGNLEKFFPDDFLFQYDKILCLGHCTIIRNDYETNRVFMKKENGIEKYKEVFSSENSFAFDEEPNDSNINQLFKRNAYHVFDKDISLNFEVRRTKFIRTVFSGDTIGRNRGFEHEKYKDALYVWNNGNICRYYKNNKDLIREDFPYIHLQKRIMGIDASILQCNRFKIVPNKFLPIEIEDDINYSNFSKIKKHIFCKHIWEVRWPYHKARIMRLLRLNNK